MREIKGGSRVLVTGVAGFIGSHLAERLLSLGCEVVGVDAFTEGYSRSRKLRNLEGALAHSGFELVEGDILDLNLEKVLRGVDGVAHMAGEPGVRRGWGDDFRVYVERNVLSTRRLLEAARGSSAGKFVYASSSSVYGPCGHPVTEESPRRPASPYGLSKLAAEEVVRFYREEWGVPATMLRYFTVYGPRQRPEMALSRFIEAALRGEPVEVFGDGEQRRDMTHVSDVVRATVAALEAPGAYARGTYNVSGGRQVSVNEMLDLVSRAVGRPSQAVYAGEARGDVRSTWADLGRARRELGYRPRVGLEAGVASQVEWARAESAVYGKRRLRSAI